jgi:transposase
LKFILNDKKSEQFMDLQNEVDKEIAERLLRHETYEVIQGKLKVSPKRISVISRALKANQLPPPHFSRGRPSKMTSKVIEFVRSETVDDPLLGSKKLAHDICNQLNFEISSASINSIRKLLHFKYTSPRTRPLLTETQIAKRLTFCQKALSGEINWAGEVIISDESRFGLFDDSRRIWLQRGIYHEITFRGKPKFQKTFMVWGAIGLGWKSKLIFLEENVTAQVYQQMLSENMVFEEIHEHFQEQNIYFQQDGAPAHRAKTSISEISKKCSLISDWPPNSPDLSVIENLWGILKRKVSEESPKTIPELKQILIQEWNNLDQTMIDELIKSTPHRFKLCLDHHGVSIGHILHRIHSSSLATAHLDPVIPPGLTIPKNIGMADVGKIRKVVSLVLKISPVIIFEPKRY